MLLEWIVHCSDHYIIHKENGYDKGVLDGGLARTWKSFIQIAFMKGTDRECGRDFLKKKK